MYAHYAPSFTATVMIVQRARVSRQSWIMWPSQSRRLRPSGRRTPGYWRWWETSRRRWIWTELSVDVTTTGLGFLRKCTQIMKHHQTFSEHVLLIHYLFNKRFEKFGNNKIEQPQEFGGQTNPAPEKNILCKVQMSSPPPPLHINHWSMLQRIFKIN